MVGKTKYLEYGSASLQVPSLMAGFDSHHHQHLYPTLTKKGFLSHHGKVSAVKLSTRARGNHIKAVKGALVKVEKKQKQVKAKVLKHKASGLAVKKAIVEVKQAVAEVKIKAKRGRKPLSSEEKAEKLRLKKASNDLRKAENKAKREANKAEKLSKKKISTGKPRGRPRKMKYLAITNG